MDPRLVFAVFAVIGAAFTLIWAWVMHGSRKKVDYTDFAPKLAVFRRRLAYVFIALSVVVFLISMTWLPYSPVKMYFVGKPQLTVKVVASQFVWNLSQITIPVGVPVEFDVTSVDVNHGFGIYAPNGLLFAQVQAMPGYINRLIVVFDEPGIYFIHCLEYCGVEHHEMETYLEVG